MSSVKAIQKKAVEYYSVIIFGCTKSKAWGDVLKKEKKNDVYFCRADNYL